MPTTLFSDESLISSMPVQYFQPHYQTNPPTIVYTFEQGNNSSSSLESSSEASSSSYPEESRSSTYSPDTTTVEDSSESNKAFLEILEQPQTRNRFRYETEMTGTHGSLLGVSSKDKYKTYIKARLRNYKPKSGRENVIIRCSLYTANKDVSKRTLHVHRLTKKTNRIAKDDPHDVKVSYPTYTAIFQQMSILYIKKEERVKMLVQKKQDLTRFVGDSGRRNFSLDVKMLKAEAIEELKTMDLDLVCLKFEALIDHEGSFHQICPPIYSNPISNLRNTKYNELKICRVSQITGSCEGGTEIYMFVEKICKGNIKVKFFEENDNGERVWEALGSFSQDDIHHQFGIVCKSPPYRNPNIDEEVIVKFCLFRPTDHSESDPFNFTYSPKRVFSRKRPRMEASISSTTALRKRNPPQIFYPVVSSSVPVTVSDVPATNNLPSTNLRQDNFNCDYYSVDLLSNNMVTGLLDAPIEQETHNSLTSSNPSFGQELAKLPSAEPDMMSKVFSDDRFEELCKTFYQDEQLQVNVTTSGNTLPSESVLSGAVLQPHPEFMNLLDMGLPSMYDADFTSNTDNDFLSLMETDLKIDGVSHARKQDSDLKPKQAPTRLRRHSTPSLTEDNIADVVQRSVKTLLEVKRAKKINEKRLVDCLLEIFSYTVGEDDNSVLHILAGSDQFNLALKFINVLRTYDISHLVSRNENNKKETALHVAVSRGSTKMTSLLLEANSNVNAKDENTNSPLHLATLRNEDNVGLDILKILLKKQPDVTAVNKDGQNVLHLAVLHKKPEIVSYLLIKSEEGSNKDLINSQDWKQGNTALHIAVHYRYTDIVKLLLNFESRIDVNIKNYAGRTPLALVFQEPDSEAKEIVDLLLEAKAVPKLEVLDQVECKEEIIISDSETDDESYTEDEIDYTQENYAKEWEHCSFFDKITISKLCSYLDNDEESLTTLLKKLRLEHFFIENSKRHWSPTLMAFKMIFTYKQEVTAETIRDHLLNMESNNPSLSWCVKYIDDMLEKQKIQK